MKSPQDLMGKGDVHRFCGVFNTALRKVYFLSCFQFVIFCNFSKFVKFRKLVVNVHRISQLMLRFVWLKRISWVIQNTTGNWTSIIHFCCFFFISTILCWGGGTTVVADRGPGLSVKYHRRKGHDPLVLTNPNNNKSHSTIKVHS